MDLPQNLLNTPLVHSFKEISEFNAKATKALSAQNAHVVTVRFLRNVTIENIAPYLEYHCLRAGVFVETHFGGYTVVDSELLSAQDKTDLYVLCLDLAEMLPQGKNAPFDAAMVFEQIQSHCSLLQQHVSVPIVIHTFMQAAHSADGIAEFSLAQSFALSVQELNTQILAYVRQSNGRLLLVDHERLLRRVGADAGLDSRLAFSAKAPFAAPFLYALGQEIATIVRALTGKSKKCIVLDCDNTLWGGIVGEDGVDGIKLEAHSYPGNVYYRFQQVLAHLKQRGILLALCSKNNPEDVWSVFDGHDESVLKRGDFVAHRINWQSKASNIEALAQELQLGLDSFVFVDDSTDQCAEVASLLPTVTVRQVPQNISELPDLLLKEGLCDVLAFTEEDTRRSEMYAQEQERKALQQKSSTLEEYLHSLDLHLDVWRAQEKDVQRVAQLSQKTNQFNVTTQRYSEADIQHFIENQDVLVYCMAARDRYGNSGLTGVFIAERNQERVHIDSLLLSCRVLGRNVEQAFCCAAFEQIRSLWQPKIWSAKYIASQRNQQVRTFWQDFGLSTSSEAPNEIYYESQNADLTLTPVAYITVTVED